MEKCKSLFGLLVLGMLALHTGAANAEAARAEAAGHAQFVSGEVRIVDPAGRGYLMQKGDPIHEGDTIDAAKDASAQIKMQDGGLIAVRPNTTLKIDSFKFKGKEDGTENSFFSLFKGGFRALTGLIGRVNKQNYRVATPVATIGIRGTDHESFFAPADLPGVPAGAYNKVNTGETSLTTNAGTIHIKPNQMGYAGGMNQLPLLQPVNANIFTAAPPPAREMKKEEHKTANGGDGKGETQKAADATGETAEIRSTDVVDNTTTATSNVGTASASTGGTATGATAVGLPVTETLVPIVMTDPVSGASFDATAQMLTTASGQVTTLQTVSYIPSRTGIEIATPLWGSGWHGGMAAQGGIIYSGGGLSSFSMQDLVCCENRTFKITGGSAPVTASAASFATTGIQFGRWTSATALENTNTHPFGGAGWDGPRNWMYGPAGYLDPGITSAPSGQMYGTFNYALDGSTQPYDRRSGQKGTLTAASVTADFTNSTFSASLALNVGSQYWSASATSVSFTNNQFSASSYPGGVGNNLTVSLGTGAPAACPTCYGSLAGGFTGQNYAGAILSYNLWDSGSLGGDVTGNAALVRTGAAITNGTPVSPTTYFVADSSNGGNAWLQTVNTLNNTVYSQALSPGGVLTTYSWGNPSTPASGYSSTTVSCSTCTAASAATSSTGIYFGTWDAGSITHTWGNGLGSASPHWITGPEAGPVFLPNALIGTKTFAYDGGMATNGAGMAGTVLGTTALTVDFTRQVVGIKIDLSVPDTSSTMHTWNAETLSGNEAPINSGNGIGGATFYASSDILSGPGKLTVSVDGTTGNGSGYVSGQLTGVGLTGAIASYDLKWSPLGPPYSQQVDGVVAFSASASNVATPYRWVMASAVDPGNITPSSSIGVYANNLSQMTFSGADLTRFDTSWINDKSKDNGSETIAINTGAPPTLANAGSDLATGISWGRWDGGSVNSTDRATGITTVHAMGNSSLHWIAGPTSSADVTLPISGTFTYTKTGGTNPTDNLGNVGTLNSATLQADFTAQTVSMGVNVTVGGTTLNASAANAPIIQKTAFYASSNDPTTSPAHLTVTCSAGCGTSHQGTIVGGFTGVGATGAMMVYGLEKSSSASAIQVISGVAAFSR